MEVAEHLTALEIEGRRLAAAAAVSGPDAEVPSCPDWVVRDLVRHQGGVHRWATGIVATPRCEPWDVEDLEELAGAWPSDASLLEWFLEGHQALLAALAKAEPDLACWTFLRAPSPLAMWSRRQAHETTVHRVDAELAAGLALSPLLPSFAADGVDELLRCFVPRPKVNLRADPPRTLRVRCLDDPGDWLVEIGPEGTDTREGSDGADCSVSGSAADLYLSLWNRPGREHLTVEGDGSTLAMFLERVQVRW
ncbi:MAG: hypothetical protein JWM85_2151 [Acidimicrobiaceae bacterium]|nr:hypothetical protein [Acidimicrobiaceae bacterium]